MTTRHSNAQMTLRSAHLADRDVETAAERIGAEMARLMALGYRFHMCVMRRRRVGPAPCRRTPPAQGSMYLPILGYFGSAKPSTEMKARRGTLDLHRRLLQR